MNRLIHETSPYLLQHAHNPVDWHAWNDATLAKANSLDKMLLISIGYSSCHWCHVMEKESFEDKAVAEIMNRHFICIKVDREERPDVDHVYMNAVQLITGSGGWPLNCFAMPDGRPFFGGTYFRKDQWVQLLENISLLYNNRRSELEKQANALTSGVRAENVFTGITGILKIRPEDVKNATGSLLNHFDSKEGGLGGAPKFPMPVVLDFLLHYWHFSGDENIRYHLELTLRKMAFGGIYDQIGGGFARYSTDAAWKVPHFEKMLYDNAQLVSLYAKAFRAFGNKYFLEIAEETLTFVARELTSPEGGFYSALDADSEGEEGKYYTWDTHEIELVLGNHAELIKKFFQTGKKGLWEDGRNILLHTLSPEEFAREQGLQPSAFKTILKSAKGKLLKARAKRIRPGLDNKIITSWNALMIKGYVNAYQAGGKKEYIDIARRSADFLITNMMENDGRLFHIYNPSGNRINGFIEDYAIFAESLLELYQVTFDEEYLRTSLLLTEYTVKHFLNSSNGLFNVTSSLDPPLIAMKQETYDNVIPSSNSVMARVLNLLGLVFERDDLTGISEKMVSAMKDQALKYPASFANWASLLTDRAFPFYTIVIAGDEAPEKAREFRSKYLPDCFILASRNHSELPVFMNRFVDGITMIYVCSGKECKLPTTSVEEAFKML